MTLPLVHLEIPNGWTINRNIFTEACPERFLNENYEYLWEFNENILQMVNISRKKILDLGWYPEFCPSGKYCIMLIELVKDEEQQLECWERPIIKYYSRNIDDVKNKIEELLMKVTVGQL